VKAVHKVLVCDGWKYLRKSEISSLKWKAKDWMVQEMKMKYRWCIAQRGERGKGQAGSLAQFFGEGQENWGKEQILGQLHTVQWVHIIKIAVKMVCLLLILWVEWQRTHLGEQLSPRSSLYGKGWLGWEWQ